MGTVTTCWLGNWLLPSHTQVFAEYSRGRPGFVERSVLMFELLPSAEGEGLIIALLLFQQREIYLTLNGR